MTSIRAFIPNTITCLNLICGSLACIMSFYKGDPVPALALCGWHWAYIFIAAAALFDFMDGAVARWLHAYSAIGKELDSLSDLVSFGLAPALLMVNYLLLQTGGLWVSYIPLWIAVMGAIRLARFNVDTRQTTSFIGLPIPANALFWIGALQLFLTVGYPGMPFCVALTVIFPLLMVSSLRLFSLKFTCFGVKPNLPRYLLLAAAAVFLIVWGVPGLAYTVIFYILLALVTPKPAS